MLQDSWFVECADYIFLDWFARCYLGMNVWLKITIDDFVYVFDAWRKWSCGVVCVCPRTNSETIVRMFIWFCYLEWMIYRGKLKKRQKYILSKEQFWSRSAFCQQNKHIPLKKMIIRITCKAVSCFSNVARVKYSIVTYRLHLH